MQGQLDMVLKMNAKAQAFDEANGFSVQVDADGKAITKTTTAKPPKGPFLPGMKGAHGFSALLLLTILVFSKCVFTDV
eukprot:COSAG05_NODE_2992_length_2430_cov_19.061776_2_plen_78_part_00